MLYICVKFCENITNGIRVMVCGYEYMVEMGITCQVANSVEVLRGCLYKQTAIYYFTGVSLILTSSPALGHDPGVHRCRMEENPPRYPHTKYIYRKG